MLAYTAESMTLLASVLDASVAAVRLELQVDVGFAEEDHYAVCVAGDDRSVVEVTEQRPSPNLLGPKSPPRLRGREERRDLLREFPR